jgi:hypothetical protein
VPGELGVLLAGARIVPLVLAPIGVGQRQDVHPRRRAFPARTVELVGTDVDERGGVAVIGGVEDDHVAPPRVGARQAQRSSFASLPEFSK